MKTEAQLRKDVSAAIKLILTEMETLAGLPPEQAFHPVEFDERRRRVVRRLWQLFKDLTANEPAAH